MKKITLLAILSCLYIFTSCEKNSIDNNSEKNLEIIAKSNEIKKIHREGLDFIFKDLNFRTSSEKSDIKKEFTPEMVASLVNDFIKLKCENENIQYVEDFVVDSEELLSIKVEDVKREMTDKSLYYFDIIMGTSPHNIMELKNLQESILKDPLLSEVDKIALHGSISIYLDSYVYWTEFFKENNIPISITRWLAPQWLVSDTVMGFYGLVGSGGNPIVGGGAAVFASACAVIFD